jgi:hypothetical protein
VTVLGDSVSFRVSGDDEENGKNWNDEHCEPAAKSGLDITEDLILCFRAREYVGCIVVG